MGWCYYLINENKKVAVELPREFDEEDFYNSEEFLDFYNELVIYLNDTDLEDLSLDVIKYILSKFYLSDSLTIMAMELVHYGFNKLLVEDEFMKLSDKNDYIILRKY